MFTFDYNMDDGSNYLNCAIVRIRHPCDGLYAEKSTYLTYNNVQGSEHGYSRTIQYDYLTFDDFLSDNMQSQEFELTDFFTVYDDSVCPPNLYEAALLGGRVDEIIVSDPSDTRYEDF